jgi:hypothetical protein
VRQVGRAAGTCIVEIDRERLGASAKRHAPFTAPEEARA